MPLKPPATRFFQLASALAIALFTLGPAGTERPEGFRFCLICGSIGTAEAILNVALFVPWGAALALGGWRGARLGAAGLALSLTVELLQLGLPGRDPSLSDLVMNTAGTLLGGRLARTAPRWLAPTAARARGLALGWAAAAAAVVIVTTWLPAPAPPPPGPYRVQWRPDMPRIPWYRGSRVLAATLGATRLREEQALARNEVVTFLAGETQLAVRFVAGPRPRRFAPVVGILHAPESGVVLLGPDRNDLVLWIRGRAAAWRLEQPALVARGLMRGVREGDTVTVVAWRDRSGEEGGWCLERDRRWHCGLEYSAAGGWALLAYPELLPGWARGLASLAWIVVLVTPAGYYSTVTLFARLRGRSTSHPRSTAM